MITFMPVYRIDPGRLERAEELCRTGHTGSITRSDVTGGGVMLTAQINRKGVNITVSAGGEITQASCTCEDWDTRGQAHHQPCKHILALAIAGEKNPGTKSSVSLPKFREGVRTAIGAAIAALAKQLFPVIHAGGTPLLIGGTGSGKTSAVHMAVTAEGWGLEELPGLASFGDADLIGFRAPNMVLPGAFARAFERARAGETVCIFMDEISRFNPRALDLLMRPLLPIDGETATSMSIPSNGEPVRVVEAPLWGIEWAPVARTPLIMATNPWGAKLDPALVRRVFPVFVQMDRNILTFFESPLKDCIEWSWKSAEEGEVPLPIEYQALCTAMGPADMSILNAYLLRLRAVDPAAARGFQSICEGFKVDGLEVAA
ncbi:MAG: SWIM zinc finger family protein [Anaerolineales bacterium]